jgi:hypothetical protein
MAGVVPACMLRVSGRTGCRYLDRYDREPCKRAYIGWPADGQYAVGARSTRGSALGMQCGASPKRSQRLLLGADGADAER